MSARVVAFIALALLGCLGGQSKTAREESARVGDQSGDVPPATTREHDWRAAATGHGAAGPITEEDIHRAMTRGAHPGDAGP